MKVELTEAMSLIAPKKHNVAFVISNECEKSFPYV